MARLSILEREKKKRLLVFKYLKKRNILKKTSNDSSISYNSRWNAQLLLQKLPRNSSPVRLRNRCFLTGRARSVYRKFGLCRHKLREYAMCGDIPGLIKSSW